MSSTESDTTQSFLFPITKKINNDRIITETTKFTAKKRTLVKSILDKLYEFYSHPPETLDTDYIKKQVNGMYSDVDLMAPEILYCKSPNEITIVKPKIQKYYTDIAESTFELKIVNQIKFKNFDFSQEIQEQLDSLKQKFVREATHREFIIDYYRSIFSKERVRGHITQRYSHPVESNFSMHMRDSIRQFADLLPGSTFDSRLYSALLLMYLADDPFATKIIGLLTSGIFSFGCYEKHIVLLLSPKLIQKDDQSRLHSTDSPAIIWQNNTKEYYFYGEKVSESLWEKTVSGKITWLEVMSIKNIDQRTAVIAVIGSERILEMADAELIDKSKRGNELYRIIIKNEDARNTIILAVKYKDPSTDRVYISFVPGIDDNRDPIETADHAMAWKGGITRYEYATLKIES
jgi:hypothetical protein